MAVLNFARLLEEMNAPDALPKPKRMALGPRVKVSASLLKRSFGMLLVKKSWATTEEPPPRVTNCWLPTLMKSLPLPLTSLVVATNGSVLGANAIRSLMLVAPRSSISCSVKMVSAEPISLMSVDIRVPLSVCDGR